MKPSKSQIKKEKQEDIKKEIKNILFIAKQSTKKGRKDYDVCKIKFWNKMGRLNKLMREFNFTLDPYQEVKIENAKRKMSSN